MKNYLTLFLLFSFFPLRAQTPYHPMLADDHAWDIFQTPTEMAICPYAAAYHAFVKGDTVLNGHTYRKILRQPILATEPHFCGGFFVDTATFWPVLHLLREDSAARKVYAYSEQYPPEYVLFDFNLQAGDTLHYPWGVDWPVNEVGEMVLNNGEMRRRFSSGFFSYNAYVEGLGGLMGAFTPMYVPLEGWEVTTCVRDNDVPLYQNDVGCIQPGSAGTSALPGRTGTVAISPNPFSDQLRLDISPATVRPLLFELFNLNGQAVWRQEIPAGSTSSDLAVPSLPPGLYYWVAAGHRGGKVLRQ